MRSLPTLKHNAVAYELRFLLKLWKYLAESTSLDDNSFSLASMWMSWLIGFLNLVTNFPVWHRDAIPSGKFKILIQL